MNFPDEKEVWALCDRLHDETANLRATLASRGQKVETPAMASDALKDVFKQVAIFTAEKANLERLVGLPTSATNPKAPEKAPLSRAVSLSPSAPKGKTLTLTQRCLLAKGLPVDTQIDLASSAGVNGEQPEPEE